MRKWKRTAAKLAAGMMTGAMLLTMTGATAFAEESTGETTQPTVISEVPITKHVLTDGHTYAPATTFEFEVKEADGGYRDDKGFLISDGLAGGLKLKEGATFSVKDTDKTPNTDGTSGKYEGTGLLEIDKDKFTVPGVYHYVVTEKKGNYDGITYDETVYDVYVYAYTGTDGSVYVGNVAAAKRPVKSTTPANPGKADLIFTNDYGKDNDGTHDLTIKKLVTGNMRDEDKEFQFDVTVDGAENEYYQVYVKLNATSAPVEWKLEGGKTETYTISHTGSIQIYGLSNVDKCTVTEHDYSNDGYTTTYDGSHENRMVTADGTILEVTNTRNAPSPTGIALSVAPYALMLALAGGLAVFFRRRKNVEQ